MGERLANKETLASEESEPVSSPMSVLEDMPPFEEHIANMRELTSEEDGAGQKEQEQNFKRKHYIGRLNDFSEIRERQEELLRNMMNPHYEGDAISEYSKEYDHLVGEYQRLMDLRVGAETFKQTIDKKYENETDPVLLHTLKIQKNMADVYPYDFIECLKNPDSLEYKRRFAILERIDKKQNWVLPKAEFDKIPILRDEIFAPSKERIMDEIGEFLGGQIDFSRVKEIKKVFDKEGIETGSRELVSFLSELLQLTIPPELEFPQRKTNERKVGSFDRLYNLITVYYNENDDTLKTINTIAHEMWHAHQQDVIIWGSEETDKQELRKKLYSLNEYNYQDPTIDYDAYRAQRCEKEAFLFGDIVQFIAEQAD